MPDNYIETGEEDRYGRRTYVKEGSSSFDELGCLAQTGLIIIGVPLGIGLTAGVLYLIYLAAIFIDKVIIH